MTPIDCLIANRTGFTSLADLLNAGGNYRPSIDATDAQMVAIADAYDAAQAMRGDDRRAYRYGAPKAAPAQEAAPAAAKQETPLQRATAAVKAARAAAMKDANKARAPRWRNWNTGLMWAIDASGDRMNGSSCRAWRGRWIDVADLLAEYPGAVEVVVQGALLCAENAAEMEACTWDSYDYAATVWQA